MRSGWVAGRAENARRTSWTRSCLLVGLVSSPLSPCSATAAHADAPGETIVIVDPGRPRPSEDEAASASVITSDRTPRSAETLPDLLADQPGLSLSRLGGIGAPAMVSLRGSAWDQVSIYVDGVNLNIAAGGPVDVSTLPIGDLERAEIYRGVTPIAYGGSAIGGVLAVDTQRPTSTGATLEVGAGSFGTWLGGGSVSLAEQTRGLYLGLHSLKTTGDFTYLDDKGTLFVPEDDELVARQNNRMRQVEGVARGFLALPGGRELSLLALGFDRGQGIPGLPKYPNLHASMDTRRGIASVAYRSVDELGDNSLLRAQVYGMGLEQRYRDPLPMIGAPADTRDRTQALGATVRASRVVSSRLLPAALVDVRHETFTPHDLLTDMTGNPSTRLTGVAGAETAIRVPSLGLSVIPSLRLEMSRDVSVGRENGDLVDAPDPVSRVLPVVRVAATAAVHEDVLLRANAGRYARLPSFFELYGNTGFVRGNHELVPERGITADAGVAYAGTTGPLAVSADAAAFAAIVTDLIQFQPGAYGSARARNIGRARVLGIESSAELRYRVARLYAQATWTDARDRSDDAAAVDHQLPYRPRAHFNVRPELRGVRAWGTELGAYVELDFTSGNFVDRANLVELPSRTLLGAGASVALDRGRVRIIASGHNLANAAVSDVIGYPLPGRAFYLTVSLATAVRTKEN